MKTQLKLFLMILIFSAVGAASLLFLFTHEIAVLHPKGMIGEKQRDLLGFATFLMLIVVIPVFFLTFWFAWRYRIENSRAKYSPGWDHSFLAECVWWGIPLLIILVMGVVNWRACERLDPFQPIEGKGKPLSIQAVALRWKWLFLYPEQKIATLGFCQFPENTPIAFEITADAPMNSFWIPQLGGQVYAMPGMRSKLHLIAGEQGVFRGCSANLSGKGFASMTFEARSVSEAEFADWAASLQTEARKLGSVEYAKLTEPSEYAPKTSYRLEDPSLFNQIIMKYMVP